MQSEALERPNLGRLCHPMRPSHLAGHPSREARRSLDRHVQYGASWILPVHSASYVYYNKRARVERLSAMTKRQKVETHPPRSIPHASAPRSVKLDKCTLRTLALARTPSQGQSHGLSGLSLRPAARRKALALNHRP